MGRKRLGVGAAVVALVAIVLGAVITLGDAATNRQITLTVIVHGRGTVLAAPSGRRCSRRCRQHVSRGAAISLRARPARGNYLVWWSGACAYRVHTRCAVRLRRSGVVSVRFAPSSVLASWNPFYKCTPVVTTIPSILGSRQDSLQGATEAGGGFQPHLRGSEDQHLLSPPCAVGGTGTFVELHDVVVAAAPERSGDGDEVVNMFDPNRPDITDGYMKTIHTEIDNSLIRQRVAPPIQPPKGTAVDVQGFVFWDPAHTDAPWHSFSGWEVHTVTAWRPATG
jgi:hypothetical protein